MLADGMMRGEEGSELQTRHGFSLRTAIVVALLTANYGSRRPKANRFRSQDGHGASVCHARSRRIACGVGLQSVNAVAEHRAAAAATQQPDCRFLPLDSSMPCHTLDAINRRECRQYPFSDEGFRFEVSTAD